MMFAPQTTPRVFALPPGAGFAQALVDGLATRLSGEPPEAWARITLWVNTRRTARAIEQIMAGRGASLLPNIRVLADLSKDIAPLPAAPDALSRQLDLAALVRSYQLARGQSPQPAMVLDLAQSLADLLDELEGEGLTPAVFEKIDATSLSRHWVENREFLGILQHYLSSLGLPYSGAEGRRRAVVDTLAARWQTKPPQGPVLVAGSTGSRAATRAFMAAVARLPQGAVILPGLDAQPPGAMPPGGPGADHPQAALLATLAALGADQPVAAWHSAPVPNPVPNPVRAALVSLALRPAPVTDQWLAEGPSLLPGLQNATESLSLITADSARHEALAIACALREAADAGQRAALITPDRNLARRVGIALTRWNIEADDSAGQPLHLSPPGLLLRLLAEDTQAGISPVRLLDILKHPLVGGQGAARGAHLQLTRALEHQVLRGGPPQLGPDDLAIWAGDDPVRKNWVAQITPALFPPASESQRLFDWVASLRARATALGPEAVWDKEAGERALALLEQLQSASASAAPQPPAIWSALLLRQMQRVELRGAAYLPHPNIAIWGPLEARVQSADLLILGGLTEGVWPARLAEDHWLSRQMRAQIDLPLPELRIGLAAHDFQCALAAPRVILSRPLRDGDSETLPARWLLRLTNLLQGLGDTGKAALEAMQTRGAVYTSLAARLDRPEAPIAPAPRPSPAPPVAARPNQLSVTAIEKLITDPYAVYASKILKLSALDPLGRAPDARERGTALHSILAHLMPRIPDPVPDTLPDSLRAEIIARFEAGVPWPATRREWQARLFGALDFLLASERTRREAARPLAVERSGALPLTIAGAAFTLTAKADRIDRAADGSIALYDYKTGATPNQTAANHTAVQLPLEGLIAAAGGFSDVPAGPAEILGYILLGAQRTTAPDGKQTVLTNLAENLVALLTAYADAAQGYTARARHELLPYPGDYDQLSRLGEWDDGAPIVPEPLP